MAELVDFLHNGARKITPQILKGVFKKLPMLKLQFAGINAPSYPHLVTQLEFLADVVEDFAEGKADEVPYVTIASAVFALVYVYKQIDIIPDTVPELGMADDSGIVRVVLIEHEKALSKYASKLNRCWAKITVEA